MTALLYIALFLLLIMILFFVKTTIRASKRAVQQQQLDATWFEQKEATIQTPKVHQRSGDQSFLTYPEWFLVFSPAEQAAYFKKETSTTFPYEQHVVQFWDSYAVLSKEIEPYFPYNNQYHTMIKVIGYSTLIEYRGKLLYEATIGRLSALIPSKMTSEDVFYGQFMQRYVDFIQKEPWYLYSFLQEFKELWLHTSLLEWNLIRKIERRFFISVELLFKALYGCLLGLGTKSAYGVAAPVTAVVIDHLPTDIQSIVPELEYLETLSETAILVNVPRYAAFAPAITQLIKSGVQIKEIAGNTTTILLTIVVPNDWKTPSNICKAIFKQKIATNKQQQRIALAVSIKNLAAVILYLENEHTAIEHIFDY